MGRNVRDKKVKVAETGAMVLLTAKQAKTVKIADKMVQAGEPPSRDLLKKATIAGYGITGDDTSQHAAQIVAYNKRDPAFMAALGWQVKEVKEFVAEEILKNITGTNEKFGYKGAEPVVDKDIYRDSLKIANANTVEQKHKVTIDHDFHGRSDSDLEFFIANGRWPEESPTIDAEILG